MEWAHLSVVRWSLPLKHITTVHKLILVLPAQKFMVCVWHMVYAECLFGIPVSVRIIEGQVSRWVKVGSYTAMFMQATKNPLLYETLHGGKFMICASNYSLTLRWPHRNYHR